MRATIKMSRRKKDPAFVPEDERPEVEVVDPDYQPSAAELEEDVSLDATFADAVKALMKPVRIKYIKSP